MPVTKICKRCKREFQVPPAHVRFRARCPECVDKVKGRKKPKMKPCMDCGKLCGPLSRFCPACQKKRIDAVMERRDREIGKTGVKWIKFGVRSGAGNRREDMDYNN